MTMFQRLLSIVALLALGACGGGGGNSGTAPFGGNTPGGGSGSAGVTALDVALSSPTIPNSGTGSVTVTVTALDAARNTVSGAAIALSTTRGVLTVSGAAGSVSDANGRLVATFTLGSDLVTGPVVITARSGNLPPVTAPPLQVVSSPAGAVPFSIELIAGATSVGTGGDGVQIRAFVKDANNNALPAAAVAFRTSSGTLSSVSAATDQAGAATATLSAGADRSNRQAVVTVTSGAITSTLSLDITGTKLTLSGPSSLIIGSTAAFDIVATDSKSNVVPNVALTATSSLGNTLSPAAGTPNASTNSSGQVRFTYTAINSGTDNLVFAGAGATVSPNPPLAVSGQDFSFISPSPSSTLPVNTLQELQVRLRSGNVAQVGSTINFASTGGTLTSNTAITDGNGIARVSLRSSSAGPVTVQATTLSGGVTSSTTLPLLVVATEPSSLILQVSPTAIAPNTGNSIGNQAQVVAKVTDAAGNPVAGKTVNFTRVADPSGGNLLQASATTDANGQATVAYRSGAESTANNGVVLSATVAGTVVTGTASLSVNQTALFIALGTGNVITNVDPQTYKKDWVVYVTDSNGIPVNGVTLTIKAIPLRYRTGVLRWNGIVWAYAAPIHSCLNEDKNENGNLDTTPSSEDDNGDGVLWPGNVISVTPGSVQTVDGRATISLVYAESYAPWVDLRLTASATVSGTESKTFVDFVVVGSGPDFSVETSPPAGATSPFGTTPLLVGGVIPATCTRIQ